MSNKLHHFTTTQKAILEVLGDGRPHHRDEVLKALGNEAATYTNLKNHLYALRQKLRPVGHDIICELRSRTVHYRHVRLLRSNAE